MHRNARLRRDQHCRVRQRLWDQWLLCGRNVCVEFVQWWLVLCCGQGALHDWMSFVFWCEAAILTPTFTSSTFAATTIAPTLTPAAVAPATDATTAVAPALAPATLATATDVSTLLAAAIIAAALFAAAFGTPTILTATNAA